MQGCLQMHAAQRIVGHSKVIETDPSALSGKI